MPVFNVIAAVKAFGFVLGVCAACLAAGGVAFAFGELLDHLRRAHGSWAAIGILVLALALVVGVVAGFVEAKH